ncbi:hypothetical protein KUC_3779 [Vreelandella boliviensis LC1]|uniref:Uncharacterized protein n=1 Tax=Vreelandella boliviensis LC1 TaxID=1072583 RepID=A0A7U9BY13_9GAMM|nr:hypothetical protein KUC_3779 [Halomonas boliviensis LC1]
MRQNAQVIDLGVFYWNIKKLYCSYHYGHERLFLCTALCFFTIERN